MLTVFMAMGAWRISQARVLTRRAAAIETLGSATMLCTDKTGTLTENRMTIVELGRRMGDVFRPRRRRDGPAGGDSATGRVRSACQRPEPFDPMEMAFHKLGRAQLTDPGVFAHPHWRLVHAYGLRPELLRCRMSGNRTAIGMEFVVAAKGAPEAIAGLCRLDAEELTALKGRSTPWRPRGCACSASRGPRMPDQDCRSRHVNLRFEFLGLVGLADPLRAERCRSGARMPFGRHQGDDDHRRLSGNGQSDRASGRPRRGELVTGE